MKIYFCCTDFKAEPWLAALRLALPQAGIEVWAPGAPAGDYAVVWAPPQQFLDEQPGLKALFNLGAGVDALTQLKLPAATKLVRLDDAGMSVQMAEYVVQALIRHFREFDGYAADVANGKWSFRKPRLRADFPVGIMGLGVLGQRVARAVQQFEFPLRGWSRSPKQVPGVRCYAGQAQFGEFLAETRVLVCLLPLTEESEARFRALTELSADWYWEQDLALCFTKFSGGAAASRLQALLGQRRWEDLPLLGSSEAQWRSHRETLERHEPFRNFIYQIEVEPGQLRVYSASGSPVFDAQGEFTGYRGVGSDITERLAAEKQIEFLSYHDTLTGLPNHLLLQDRFGQIRDHAKRSDTRVALLYLDLDNFKNINDSLGHEAGDVLLRQVAQRLLACVGERGTVSRQGGDEFSILVPEQAHTDEVSALATRIMEQLQQPFVIRGQEISTSASMGVSIFPDDGTELETLRKKADVAMYQAKQVGRNTFRFFDTTMNVEAAEHLRLRNGLRRALEAEEFELYYQPQIDLRTGAVTGVEALLRWHHPELGLVPPARFIPVAEDSGLIVPIGAWVLRQACRQAVAWQRAGLPAMTMAVNLSAVQFKRGDVEPSVLLALKESGLAPALLELELTESILIQNAEGVLASLKRLKQQGVKLSIDDFGTGYSSLSYLKRFDIDKLKIDQSFVRDLGSDPDDAAIVRAVIQMAHSLSLRSIAEGVETREMVGRLCDFGCDEAQGYHFARPLPASALEAFLRELAVKPICMPAQRPA